MAEKPTIATIVDQVRQVEWSLLFETDGTLILACRKVGDPDRDYWYVVEIAQEGELRRCTGIEKDAGLGIELDDEGRIAEID